MFRIFRPGGRAVEFLAADAAFNRDRADPVHGLVVALFRAIFRRGISVGYDLEVAPADDAGLGDLDIRDMPLGIAFPGAESESLPSMSRDLHGRLAVLTIHQFRSDRRGDQCHALEEGEIERDRVGQYIKIGPRREAAEAGGGDRPVPSEGVWGQDPSREEEEEV